MENVKTVSHQISFWYKSPVWDYTQACIPRTPAPMTSIGRSFQWCIRKICTSSGRRLYIGSTLACSFYRRGCCLASRRFYTHLLSESKVDKRGLILMWPGIDRSRIIRKSDK